MVDTQSKKIAEKLFNTEKEFVSYADDISKKITDSKMPKKFHYKFLKNLNDLISENLDLKTINELEKEISTMYNNKLKKYHKKDNKKGPTIKQSKKFEMGKNDDEYDDYYDENDDYVDDF